MMHPAAAATSHFIAHLGFADAVAVQALPLQYIDQPDANVCSPTTAAPNALDAHAPRAEPAAMPQERLERSGFAEAAAQLKKPQTGVQ